MNTLKLKLNPYKDINKISLDDKPISSYSELSNFMKEPFLKWADKLLDTAERELNDEYDLVVQAEEFERLFLQDLQNDFDACQNYSTEDYELNLTADERYKGIVKLARDYGVEIKDSIKKIKVYQENNDDLPLADKGGLNDSFLYILTNEEKVKNIPDGDEAKIILVPSAHNEIVTVGGQKFLWRAKEDVIPVIIHAIINRFARVPAIVTLYEKLRPLAEQMNEKELETLTNTTEIDSRVIVKPIPRIEVGTTYNLEFDTIPEGREVPPLKCVSLNPDIVSVEGYMLTALRSGKAEIEFYKADENIPFDKKSAVTFKDNFVQAIELLIPETRIPVGEELQISAKLFPADADDADSLKWTTSNSEIAVISETGLLTALEPGYVTVFAKTRNAETSGTPIAVIPIAQKIIPSLKSLTCHITDRKPLPVQIYPEDCFDSSYKVGSSDPTVATVEFTPDGIPEIIAVGIGTCDIIFQAAIENVTAKCEVTVTSKLLEEADSNGKSMLGFTLGALLITLLSSGVFAVMGAVVTMLLGFSSIKNNKGDTTWAVLMMALAAVILLGKLAS